MEPADFTFVLPPWPAPHLFWVFTLCRTLGPFSALGLSPLLGPHWPQVPSIPSLDSQPGVPHPPQFRRIRVVTHPGSLHGDRRGVLPNSGRQWAVTRPQACHTASSPFRMEWLGRPLGKQRLSWFLTRHGVQGRWWGLCEVGLGAAIIRGQVFRAPQQGAGKMGECPLVAVEGTARPQDPACPVPAPVRAPQNPPALPRLSQVSVPLGSPCAGLPHFPSTGSWTGSEEA